MKTKLMAAVAVLAIVTATGAARAEDATTVQTLKAQAAALKKQNDALEKRLNKLEQAQTVKVAAPASTDFMASVTKGPLEVITGDGPLCWNGICAFGTVDVGAQWAAHGLPQSGQLYVGESLISKYYNRAYFGVNPNGLSQSTVGLKGEKQIFGDVSGVFMASTGFNPNSGQLASATGSLAAQNGLNQKANYGQMANLGDGSRGGQAFNDQLYAGLASQSLGQLTVGRHRSFGIDMVGAYDPAGGSYAFSVIGYSGVMSGGGDTESARMDNSIKYKVDLGGVHVGALYKFADGAGGCLGGAGWTAATCAPVGARNDAYEFNAGFSYAGFDVDALGGHINQAVSAAALTSGQAAANAFNGVSITGANLVNPANSLAGTITDNTVAAIAAKYSWNQFKLFAGYEHILYQNPTNAMGVGANAQGGYILSAVTNGLGAGQNDKSLNVFWTGVKYAYDPKLDFTLSYYHYLQNQYASVANALTCANAVQSTRNGACNGTLDAVSFYADYHFNKRFDAYAGMMVSNVAGGLSSGYLNSTNFAPTAGVRYQF